MSNQKEMDANELQSLRASMETISELWDKKIVSDDNDIILDEDAALRITVLLSGA